MFFLQVLVKFGFQSRPLFCQRPRILLLAAKAHRMSISLRESSHPHAASQLDVAFRSLVRSVMCFLSLPLTWTIQQGPVNSSEVSSGRNCVVSEIRTVSLVRDSYRAVLEISAPQLPSCISILCCEYVARATQRPHKTNE
jgi:hypothetical protein